MGRLLVLVLLAVVAVWLIRRALRAPTRSTEVPQKTEDLVRCAHCGVHLPRAEAHAAAGALYCSDQHAQLGPGKR
ncbi:MAG: preprotein translocase subunit YajC [Betaproteobacteria bacterium]|nr:preprotein translocase subunit YajC [Betaproteobacteria bacterium]